MTINPGGTVNTTAVNALGFTAGLKVDTLNITGGILNTTAGGDQGWAISINLTGGTLQSNGGVSNAAATQLFALGGGSSVNSLASATTSVISGRVNLRENNAGDQLPFNVDDGAAPIDLNVSAAITVLVTRGLVKNGAGTMLTRGAGTYTGTTTINARTVALDTAGSLASNLITVASGATFNVSAVTGGYTLPATKVLTLSPGSLLVGPATLAPGAILNAGGSATNDVTGTLASSGTINVAGLTTAGTLTLASGLSLSGGTMNFDLANVTTAGSGMNDLVAVGGNLTLTGNTALAISKLNGTLTAGSYTLLTYGGTVTGDATNLTISGLPNTSRQTYGISTSTVGKILLNVAGFAANLIWSGDGTSNAWDLTTNNWKNGASADRFFSQDNIVFDDTGSNSSAVNISVDVLPGSIAVNNTIKDYIFGGPASITGTTGLTKAGPAR